MDHDGELPRHRDGGVPEADALAKLKAPLSAELRVRMTHAASYRRFRTW
jgi:hypothetical protein